MQTFVPNLWFDHQAEEAARFYTSIFRNSKLGHIARYGAAGAKVSGQQEGAVMTVDFELDGRKFVALNGGPQFQFTPAISFMVPCDTQGEIDALTEKLCAGGEQWPCGWVKDKYGLCWQIVPSVMERIMQESDPATLERVMEAVLKMQKIDLAAVQKAYAGR